MDRPIPSFTCPGPWRTDFDHLISVSLLFVHFSSKVHVMNRVASLCQLVISCKWELSHATLHGTGQVVSIPILILLDIKRKAKYFRTKFVAT